jgi:hypothetical protein
MKLRTPKENKEKFSFKRAFPLIFILTIMVLSVFGVIFFGVPTPESFKYKGHTFFEGIVSSNQQSSYGYTTTINENKYTFLYDPRELDNLEITEVTLQQLQYAQKFYVSGNPLENIAPGVSEFNRLILPLLERRIVTSCSVDIEQCGDLLIKTCEDATPENKVILFEESENPKLTYELNCLKFQGSGEDLAKLTNKLAMNFLL